MAELRIDGDMIDLNLTAMEKVEGMHRNLRVPRAAVVAAWQVPDGTIEVQGLKIKGSGLTGVLKVGTFMDQGHLVFAVAHRGRPAVVIELAGQHFGRLVVSVDDPAQVIAALKG
jgi:hypothetical protein